MELWLLLNCSFIGPEKSLFDERPATNRVSKFSKNHFREIFEAHSKIIYFREISTIFIIIFAKFSNHFLENFREKFRENVNFRENENFRENV